MVTFKNMSPEDKWSVICDGGLRQHRDAKFVLQQRTQQMQADEDYIVSMLSRKRQAEEKQEKKKEAFDSLQRAIQPPVDVARQAALRDVVRRVPSACEVPLEERRCPTVAGPTTEEKKIE